MWFALAFSELLLSWHEMKLKDTKKLRHGQVA
jgi:hypothetical protein